MRIEPAQLDLPHAEGARLIVRALLEDAEENLDKLEENVGDDALHDFRVAVRRLRSVTRALRPSLAGVRAKHERRLRAVAGATSEARDAEVQLTWLERERATTAARDVPALDALVARIEQRQRGGHSEDVARAAAQFRGLAARMHRRLARAAAGEAGPSLSEALADVLRTHTAELLARLDEVSGPFDAEHAHDARIAAKRLRYVLEPLRGCARADTTDVVGTLKELQDLLGELHDAHVLGDVVGAALVDGGAERARRAHAAIQGGAAPARALRLAARDGVTRGLVAIDGRVAERAAAVYGTLTTAWLPTRRQALARGVAAVADALAPLRMGQAAALRRFLLVDLPGEVLASPALLLERGWLPGPAPREWLLRIEGTGSARYLRGGGAAGAEEAISVERFGAEWPETAGARHLKRRRVVVRGGRTWTIDSHGEHGPHLAEIAAPRTARIELPKWLERAVVREVTGEKAYDDERIAARQRANHLREAPSPQQGRDGGKTAPVRPVRVRT